MASRIEDQRVFRAFNAEGPLRIYHRHLPHWRQPGASYFVTFRQADSIPPAVLRAWQDLRTRFYRAHGIEADLSHTDNVQLAKSYRRIPPSVRRAFEREQSRLLHEELDKCHGSCLLRYLEPQQIVDDALRIFDGERLWLGDSVIMPNHVHAIIQPLSGFELEDLLGSIKKWTSRLIGEWMKSQPSHLCRDGATQLLNRFWQQESYDRIIRDAEELDKFNRYIANNPQVARCRPGEARYRQAVGWVSDPTR